MRFLKTLHARCWLGGFGWMNVGAAGQLLERSIIDRMVGAAERLVFEGPPVVEPPLHQDAAARRPTVVAGDVLDYGRRLPAAEHGRAAGLRPAARAGEDASGAGVRREARRMDRRPEGAAWWRAPA